MTKKAFLLLALAVLLSLGSECGNGEGAGFVEVAFRSPTVTWSPDGAYLAYNLSPLMYVASADGSEKLLICDCDARDGFTVDIQPNISPDGSQIVFATNRHRENWFSREILGNVNRNLEIGVSALDGSDYRRLTKNEITDVRPVWSPDGARIAFISSWYAHGHSTAGIRIMDSDGSDIFTIIPQSITPSVGAPVWSPDGQRIAFRGQPSEVGEDGVLRWEEDISVFTIAVEGTDLRKIGRSDVQPVWSPDGSRIVYAVNEGGRAMVYTANPDGSDVQELLPERAFFSDWALEPREASEVAFFNVYSVHWAPDGSEVLFHTRLGQIDGSSREWTGIIAAPLDRSGVRTVLPLRPEYDLVVPSPDGSRIAFKANYPTEDGGWLYTMALDGTDRRIITKDVV